MTTSSRKTFPEAGNHPEAHNPKINPKGGIDFDAQDSVFGMDVHEDNSDWAWLQWEQEVKPTDKVIIKDSK